MLRIPCPYCGARDEIEYTCRGDATVTRPGPDGDIAAFHDDLSTRTNPRGWQVEWWQHSAGCRAFLKVLRHTVTHEIRAVATAAETLEVPPA